jgi:hypothetical protein
MRSRKSDCHPMFIAYKLGGNGGNALRANMSTSEPSSGGFHFGRVGGDVNLHAGGDIVGGDKTTTASTAIQRGFAGEEQKLQFQAQIDQLREALRALKVDLEAHPALSDDQKEDAATEILRQVTALREVKTKTADTLVGKEAPLDVASEVEATLDRAGSMIDTLQAIAQNTGAIVGAAGQFAAKYGPLLLSARHLFGLP